MTELNLESVDAIVKKLVRAKENHINMVAVWKPGKVEDDREEDYPDWIACNFDDPRLAAALLGRAEASGADNGAEV